MRNRIPSTNGAGPIPRLLCAGFLGLFLAASPVSVPAAEFRRGDSNADGRVDISDPLRTFGYLFLGASHLTCFDAADAEDSGKLDLTDGVYTLSFLFLGGSPPPSPGPFGCGGDLSADELDCADYPASLCDSGPVDPKLIGHVLNRLGYGPTAATMEAVRESGLGAYIEEQLHPEAIDESGNVDLETREDALFQEIIPSRDEALVAVGQVWRYRKGETEPTPDGASRPTTAWAQKGYDDTGWASGPTGIGVSDGDDATVISDMANRYVSLYLRKTFDLADPAAVDRLILRIDYDDGFVAYLNGSEVARRGLIGSPPACTALAANHEAGEPEEIDVSAHKGLLAAGSNVLAIQVHNTTLVSPDLSMIPELIDREILPVSPLTVIRGAAELQRLPHVRGIYSRRQLQEVLAEFWDNHFTTDLDKVADYIDKLQDSDGSDALSAVRARAEAAQAEYREHEFYRQNALGNFGDLLLYSATSPPMLIYLDNILNVKGSANENYAREILELFAFGVDNRYVQKDIQELAKCFTGWTICKVAHDRAPSFPESALSPPQTCGVAYEDTELVAIGPGWRYWKGTAEPSPDGGGLPTTAWTAIGFADAAWLSGSTGIGYGDGDDATVLTDMKDSYASVYLRRTFTVADPSAIENLVLEVSYDDGFVAYLNGVEVARSSTMNAAGAPPARTALASENHEVTLGAQIFNLNRWVDLLVAGTNVLAFQVHNNTLGSGDLSMLPRLLDRRVLPGSVENSDPSGVWVFHFNPDKHDTGAKSLFTGTAYAMTIPAGRTGMAGLSDAIDVVQAMVEHPSTAEFICIKLIQKLVSDEISLAAYRAGTVPDDLRALLADTIAAWNSTSPKGNIRAVLEAILDPVDRASAFWSPRAFRAKVKTPIEFANSSIRVLDGLATGEALPTRIDAMGMDLFTRDDPDGWPEIAARWIDTGSLLARIDFAQTLAENREPKFTWQVPEFLTARGLDTAEEIVDFFDGLLFQGTLPAGRREQLLEFLTTDIAGNPLPLDPARSDFKTRTGEFVGLLLSLPEWNYQ